MKLLFLLLLSTLIVSCGKKDDKNLEEKTQRELVVENENLERRAILLENDLARKQEFYTAVEGTYEGNFMAGEKEFKTRMTLIPSLPPYTSNRIRTLEEVTADLNNLSFSLQTTHWNAKGTAVASGCIFSEIRPDYDNGQIAVAAESCANVYKVSLFDSSDRSGEGPIKTSEVLQKSRSISKKILNNEIKEVNEIHVVIQPTLVAKTFIAVLKRVQP